MADLLIHSMAEFAEIIIGAMERAGVADIVEIGAEYGGMTSLLADHAAGQGGRLTTIDPEPKPEFRAWMASQDHVTHVDRPSLEAIAGLAPADAWVIDGDHNWYTVYNELRSIEASCIAAGKPMLAFLHDIGWPSGRRDMYYAPERIPAAFRHAYSYEGGALPGVGPLQNGRGFRGMGQFAWATHEGGPRNGVLTAVEDFVADAEAEGRNYAFAQVPGVFGLGILIPTGAPWSEAVAELVLPYHDHPLLHSLERNRLANYLAVIDWQDREAERVRAAA